MGKAARSGASQVISNNFQKEKYSFQELQIRNNRIQESWILERCQSRKLPHLLFLLYAASFRALRQAPFPQKGQATGYFACSHDSRQFQKKVYLQLSTWTGYLLSPEDLQGSGSLNQKGLPRAQQHQPASQLHRL